MLAINNYFHCFDEREFMRMEREFMRMERKLKKIGPQADGVGEQQLPAIGQQLS